MSIRGFVMLSVTVMLSMAACASAPTPQPSSGSQPLPSTAPSATPAVDNTVQTLQLSGSSISSLNSAGSVVEDYPFADGPAPVLALFTELFGPGADRAADGGDLACADEFQVTEWSDGDTVDVAVRVPREPGDPERDWVVSFETAELSGIALTTSAGIAVGDDVSSFVDGLPNDQVSQKSGPGPGGLANASVFSFDKVGTVEHNDREVASGGQTLAADGVLLVVAAPGGPPRVYC